jgi:hypothetical protein
MANINITFDTKTKDMSVSINGQPLKNVDGISISKYDNKPEIAVYMREKVEDEGLTIHTSLQASVNEELTNKAKIVDFSEFDKYDTEKLAKGLCTMLGKN